ncbi:hypothetical protein SISNIDRAFT_482038 [Sistotremastrum niveocremeum HHB9708]|uniref:Uncharacterized protein n=1 Tax=Sistotremastrum niveocremeum HHB9708 TaxID=1314777 RepID=A0A164YP34_9AGAM|nr:hypothetical protein SISNIDRAFT_482038 [Sistotremastrum niveocremeum HHB9708]
MERFRVSSIFLCILIVYNVKCAITQPACYVDNVDGCFFRQGGNGTMCYKPYIGLSSSSPSSCPASNPYASIATVHLQGSHSSIAYYALDNTYLGDVNYIVSFETYICISGVDSAGVISSRCCDAPHDEWFCQVDPGGPCVVSGGPASVTDGCYQTNNEVASSSSSSSSTASSSATSSSPAASASSDQATSPSSSPSSSASSSTTTSSPSAPPSQPSPSPSPTTTTAPSTSPSTKSGISPGTLAGAIVGILVLMSLGFVGLWWYMKRKVTNNRNVVGTLGDSVTLVPENRRIKS